jgi:hypothetical protein
MPRFDAASISMTSTEPPAAISRQLAQTPQGLIGGAFFAVEAAGDDARGGGLAGAALAGKNVAVGDAVLRDGIAQRGLDVLLVQHIVERLRTVFSRDDLIHGAERDSRKR